MKTTRIVLALSVIVATGTFALAGPNGAYWNQRRVDRATAPTTRGLVTSTDALEKARDPSLACCEVTQVKRAKGTKRLSATYTQVTCPGCPEMSAGDKCPML